MRKLINHLMGLNAWLLFGMSVAGAVFFSILLGLLLNTLFYDGTNNLLMLGAVVIPAIDAPVFIVLLIIAIKELQRSRSELDRRVADRTRALERAYVRLNHEIKERRETEKKLFQAHKLEAIGTLAGGIAHDFNNILSSIIGFTELAIDDAAKGSVQAENLQEVHIAGIRAKDLVLQILKFARQADEETRPLRVDVIVKEVLRLLRSSIPSSIEIRSAIESEALVLADPINVHQVLMNLCTNAAHAMPQGGVLDVKLCKTAFGAHDGPRPANLDAGEYLELTVADTGAGIPEEILPSIFEPYFTTKPPGEGTGMGLATVHGIISGYRGAITVESAPSEGTVFRVFIPVTEKRQQETGYQNETLPLGTESILVVDDEVAITSMARQALGRLGYTVDTRSSSVEALALFRAKPETFDLVITDMTMPQMTGDRLIVELRSIRPDIRLILCTGYSKQLSEDRIASLGIQALIYKPIVKTDLAKTVRAVLDAAVPPR